MFDSIIEIWRKNCVHKGNYFREKLVIWEKLVLSFTFVLITFQEQPLHWTWLVIRPENGCISTETDGMLTKGMVHRDFHDLKGLLQSPLFWALRDSNSEDLARIIPGLHPMLGDMLDMDEVEVIIWLLQFLSKPFGVSMPFFTDAISLHDALLRFRIWDSRLSATPLIFNSIFGLGGSASDKQPFWKRNS